MKRAAISFDTRKSLCNHLGETAGTEVADGIAQLLARVEHLERSKVDVTPIISPGLLRAAESADRESPLQQRVGGS